MTNKEQDPQLIQLERGSGSAAGYTRSKYIERSLDNTALAAYQRCPRLYLYSMVMNRRRTGPPSPALSYGSVWHVILEAHYRSGGNYDTVLRAAADRYQPSNDPSDHRTLQRALDAYGDYLKRWGQHDEDMAQHGRTVGYPDAPVVELTTEYWWPGALHPYTGKMDRVFQLHGLYYVEDHKSSGQLGSNYFYQWELKQQMLGYAWLAQLATGLPIAGVRINAHGVLKTQNKFERQIISFSQERLQDWALKHFNSWVRKIEEDHRQYNWALQEAADGIEVLDRVEAFPCNFDACDGKYGMCAYAGVCSMPPSLRQRVLEQEFAEAAWDPMAAEDEGLV